MTTKIFKHWLQEFDQKTALENREVLLVIDNCSAHPKPETLSLKATEVIFLPPNTSPVLQPLDQGVIKNLKVHYRSLILRSLMSHVDSGASEEFSVSLLDAVCMLETAWNKVLPTTIMNCFHNHHELFPQPS